MRKTIPGLEKEIGRLKQALAEERTENNRLRMELQRIRETNSQGITVTEQITERRQRTRGAPRKADPERRQYIRELRKIGHSLQSIADAAGMSKTQVFAIVQETDTPGRWYSQDPDGSRTYYQSYLDAVSSGCRKIHFEQEATPGELCSRN